MLCALKSVIENRSKFLNKKEKNNDNFNIFYIFIIKFLYKNYF